MSESWRVATASRVQSLLVLVLAAAVPLIVLGATGLNVAARAAILARVDDVGTRLLVVTSLRDPSISASAVEEIARLSGVTWVLGLGPATDVRSRASGGSPTPLRLYKSAGAPIRLAEPVTGAVYVSELSAARLGIGGAIGVVDPGGLKVAGWFDTASPIEDLEAFALTPANGGAVRLERVIVSVADVEWVEPTAASIPFLLGVDGAASVSIERSGALLAARRAVADEVSRQDRALVVALLGVEILIVGAVVFASTLAARRDYGRRRALGATIGQLSVLVIMSALWPACAGAALGAVTGWLQLWRQLGRSPDWSFAAAIGALALLSVAISAALPALIAARRDPLRVLRTP